MVQYTKKLPIKMAIMQQDSGEILARTEGENDRGISLKYSLVYISTYFFRAVDFWPEFK